MSGWLMSRACPMPCVSCAGVVQSSPDLGDLVQAKDSIEQAAKYLNEAKRKAEAQRQLINMVPLILKYPDAKAPTRPSPHLTSGLTSR